MPQIDWTSFSGPSKYVSFIDFCLNHYLKQHIHVPTRPSSDAILDLIFSTIGTEVRDISINECFGSSDHSIINYNIDLPCLWKSFVPKQTRRNYNKADWNNMQNLLSKINWDIVFNYANINDVWENFKQNLSQVVSSSIPLKKTNSWRIKSSAKIRSALRLTRRYYSLYRTLKSKESLLRLIHAKDRLQNLIDKQVFNFERNVVESLRHNPKKYWSYVNSKLANKKKFLNFIQTNERKIYQPDQMSEALNDYFHKSFNHSSENELAVNATDDDEEILDNVNISFHKVQRIIQSLPNKRSEDNDGFSYLILKGGGDILSLQLTRLFIFSLSTGKIPQDWKKSVIYPIKKKANPKTVEDYRPINITSCICRVFERIIRNALYSFLSNTSCINETQHGFIPGKSTTTALLSYANDLSLSLDNGKCVDVAYFDFTKAFDSVRHDYLINKLLNIGIRGPLLTWLIDYFRNRSQIVNVHGCLSSERPVTSGVIQGSVLGPLLFIIFINDVDEIINNSIILKYADDIRIYREFNSDEPSQQDNCVKFQNDINALYSWSQQWDLKFNSSKCSILHFGHANYRRSYKLNDVIIQSKSIEKDLGILFSCNMKFDEHIDSIVLKANKQLGIIARVFTDKSLKTIIPLYKSFVRPLLEYNSIIWSPYTKKKNEKIEKIQKRMLNLVRDLRPLN